MSAESSGIHFVFLKEEAVIDGMKENAVNLVIHIMSQKEEMGGVGQAEIAGNFNTRFIFLKEEKIQIAAVAKTGELYRNKKTARGFSRTVFLLSFFVRFFITF